MVDRVANSDAKLVVRKAQYIVEYIGVFLAIHFLHTTLFCFVEQCGVADREHKKVLTRCCHRTEIRNDPTILQVRSRNGLVLSVDKTKGSIGACKSHIFL